jgi:hypothetical protein
MHEMPNKAKSMLPLIFIDSLIKKPLNNNPRAGAMVYNPHRSVCKLPLQRHCIVLMQQHLFFPESLHLFLGTNHVMSGLNGAYFEDFRVRFTFL